MRSPRRCHAGKGREKVKTTNLKPLLKPKSVAVIGVSLKNDNHPANAIYYKNKVNPRVKAFPVNATGGLLHGEPIYPGISAVAEKIDLAVIVVRAELVPQTLAECIEHGVRGAVVVSGGFAESGKPDLQARITAIAREGHFPFIGPNCLGIFSPGVLDTFFIQSERIVQPSIGRVALVSQSGGILLDLLARFAAEGVGLSTAVSIGNKAVIGEMELLAYFIDDPDTDVISFYIEGFGEKEGRNFVLAARRSPKPVIVLKSGKSEGTARVISSHTASLAGDYSVFSAVLAQHGIVEAKNGIELTSFCEVFSSYKMSIEGRVGIVSDSGGHSVLAADACAAYGLSVPPLSNDEQDELRNLCSPSVRPIGSFANPVDLTGSAIDDDFVAAARYLCRKKEIDSIIVLLLPYAPALTQNAGAHLSMIHRQEGKPFIAYMPHVDRYAMLIEGFRKNQIPVAQSVQDAVQMIAVLRRRARC